MLFRSLLRCTPPQHSGEAAALFDEEVEKAVFALLHVRADATPADAAARARAQRILRLPMRLGGLGLPQQQHIRTFAHAGALAQVAHLLQQPALRQRALGSEQLNEAVRLIEEAEVPLLARLAGHVPTAAGAAELLKFYGERQRGPRERGGHPADRLQHHLSSAYHQEQRDGVVRSLVPAHQAVLQSGAGIYGGAWLSALPTSALTTMPNAAFITASRLRLTLPPESQHHRPLTRCICGVPLTPSDANNHFLGCQQLKATGATMRHDRVVRALEAVARAGGASVHTEVPTGHGDRRYDLLIIANGSTIAVDATVPHPQAPTYMQTGDALRSGAVATLAEHAKRSDYAREAHEAGFEFYPLAVESLGSWSKSGRQLALRIPSLTRSARRLCGRTGAQMRQWATQAISVAVQQGNAAVYMEGYTR